LGTSTAKTVSKKLTSERDDARDKRRAYDVANQSLEKNKTRLPSNKAGEHSSFLLRRLLAVGAGSLSKGLQKSSASSTKVKAAS
jgi:hypothetical protein